MRRMRERVIRDWGQERTLDYGEDRERAQERAREQLLRQLERGQAGSAAGASSSAEASRSSSEPLPGRPHSHTAPEIVVASDLAPAAAAEDVSKAAPQVVVIGNDETRRVRSVSNVQDFAARQTGGVEPVARTGVVV
jgi:hypothetical protein